MDRLSTRLLPRWKPYIAVFFLMCCDIVAVLGALAVSLALRFDGDPFSEVYRTHISGHTTGLSVVVVLYVAIFAAFRLYRYAWRFASLEMLWGVVLACTIGLLTLVGVEHLVDGGDLPRSVIINFWILSIALVGGTRILLRLASLSRSYGTRVVGILQRDLRPRRVVILGAGAGGARLLRALREDAGIPYNVIGFLDDDERKQGVYIRDVRVLGPLKHLYMLLVEREVDEVLIALPNASGAQIREFFRACRKQNIRVKIIPVLKDFVNGDASIQIEEISVEDLLRRPPVRIDIKEIGGYLAGKRVLVTGAGGSIGSELCRQIVDLGPAELVLFGHGENSIHQIHNELRTRASQAGCSLHTVIGSVVDETCMDQVFYQHRPHVVFHAAAHKHVPIMELNVVEAAQNNVLGTHCVISCCGRYDVERMVLISTDKAVEPSSVMGATKWLCEQVARDAAAICPSTTFVTVRFGNVLGSRGSVVPLFRDQIKRGGPVTVTHPEMTRFFMSVPEAVQLVLQAGSAGKSGELYLLDMGEPVRVVDLAHDMIRLCGHEPDVEIPVVFTGPRPGEKLHEHLTSEEERKWPCFEGLFFVDRPRIFTHNEIAGVLERIRQMVDLGQAEDMRGLLDDVVPGFAARSRFLEPMPVVDNRKSVAHS